MLELSEPRSQVSSRSKNNFHQIRLASIQAFKPLWTVGERRNSGDERLHSNRSAGQEFDCPRILSGRRARSLEANLSRNHFLKRQRNLGRNVSHEDDTSAFPDTIDRGVYSFSLAHCFDCKVNAGSICEFRNALSEIWSSIQCGSGSKFSAEFKARRIHVSNKNARTACNPQSLLQQESDRASTDDQGGTTGGDGNQRNRVKCHSNRFQQRSSSERKILRQAMDNSRRNHNKLGKSARAPVVITRHAQNLATIA